MSITVHCDRCGTPVPNERQREIHFAHGLIQIHVVRVSGDCCEACMREIVTSKWSINKKPSKRK